LNVIFKKASKVIRQKATLLISRTYLIRWYKFFSFTQIHTKDRGCGSGKGWMGCPNCLAEWKDTREEILAPYLKDLWQFVSVLPSRSSSRKSAIYLMPEK
jgi:hypothetical protein